MLLTETIKKSTSAIKKRRLVIENKQHVETYIKALSQLSMATDSIKEALDCAVAMKGNGIISTPLLNETTRSDLLSCINDCGNGVSEMNLALESVKLLKAKGDAFSAQIKMVWLDASPKYSESSRGYLSIIGSLTDDPQRATELADSITKTIANVPSTKAIKRLVSDVKEAQQIVDEFSLSPKIEQFLKKVSSQQATVADLEADILRWLSDKELLNKLKIKF